jgi:hypothetical protein
MHFYEQQDIKQERHLEQNVLQVLARPWPTSTNIKTCINFLSVVIDYRV